ncbi:hypothetical protein [Kitasatospora purpeofusca]|uniref:hypothetical protein n=1 Tax=Kitasatospora purpeofusca TaxID=67352 RepID=UPI002250886D|nr:hypothetical protein [Kitasatospora purpeofusca]MCX4756368.1 hypothetical protein [Kitasatospora purpeofusca]WSR35806.1 hypothetical protein OG715_35570 [Kitasatospora purpeofusca]
MAGGKLWGYVASGARVLGGLGPLGRSGALAGARLLKGVGGGGRPEPDRPGAMIAAPIGTVGAGSPGRSAVGGMAGPQLLSRPELERLRWIDRAGGCVPDARHVQVAEVVGRVLRGGGRGASVVVRLPVGLPVVIADAPRLEAALAGLVDHAIRRSPTGARVLVRADPLPGPDGLLGARGGVGPGGVFGRRAAGKGSLGKGAFTGGAFGGSEAWTADPARVELRVVDRGASEPPDARRWLLAGMYGEPGIPGAGWAPGGGIGGPGSGGGSGWAVGGAGEATAPRRGTGGPEPVGPSISALVRAAGGRLRVEQTAGGGLTLVLVLAVARD